MIGREELVMNMILQSCRNCITPEMLAIVMMLTTENSIKQNIREHYETE
jgi:hypothetical protein